MRAFPCYHGAMRRRGEAMAVIESINYRLPRTDFVVAANLRQAITTGKGGSHLMPVVDISIVPMLAGDDARVLVVEQSLGESIDLTLTFDAQGLVTGINSGSSVDFTPLIDLAGKATAVAITLGLGGPAGLLRDQAKFVESGTLQRAAHSDKLPLEAQWAQAQPALAAHLAALNARSGKLLDALATAPVAEVATTGKALETVQAQIAGITEARRLWIAARETTESLLLHLTPEDLLRVEGTSLPARLLEAVVKIPPAQRKLAEMGCLVAIHDPDRPKAARPGATVGADTLVTRIPRRAEIAVYRHMRSETDMKCWQRDPDSVQDLNLLDGLCGERQINLNNRGITLGLHPDGALKAFGLKKVSALPGTAKSLTGAADGIQTGHEKARKAAQEAAKKAVDSKARPAGETAQIGENYEFLAVIHSRRQFRA